MMLHVNERVSRRLGSEPRDSIVQTGNQLAEFEAEFPEWKSRLHGEEPVYAIPQELMDDRQAWKLLGDLGLQDTEAEAKFSGICSRGGVIGVCQTRPISFLPLLDQPLRLPAGLPRTLRHPKLGFEIPSEVLQKALNGQISSASQRQLGVVGYLLTEPEYLEGVAALRMLHASIPAKVRPILPLLRPVQVSPLANLEYLGKPVPHPHPSLQRFDQSRIRFQDRWGVAQFTTWDWPMPYGPHLPGAPPAAGGVRDQQSITITIPLDFSVQKGDDFFRLIQNQQRQRAKALQRPSDLAGLQHHEQYAQMARLIHLEQTIRSRFEEEVPRGFGSKLDLLAVPYLAVSDRAVRRLRNWIEQCRRGERSTIAKLRVHN